MNRVLGRIRGFTLIELIVVIAVIGILATITAVGFGRYQADARDARRASSASVIAESLEKYYDQNGEYPSCPSVTGSATTVTAPNAPLAGVDTSILKTPVPSSGDTNSIKCSDLTSTSDDDIFAYVGDGSPTCTTGDSCLQFTLKYKEESSNSIKTIAGRRKTDIATSNSLSLTATTVSTSQINLTWNAVGNAAGYAVERATNGLFTANLVQTTAPTNSLTVTGLAAGTTYSFRVKPIATVNTTKWSNAQATTTPVAPTSVTATTNSSTQITVTWTGSAGATSYTLQYSRDSGFGTQTSIPSLSGTSRTITGLAQGARYYVRVIAVATTNSASSNVANTVTTIDNAAAYNVSSSSTNSSLSATANSVCPAGTNATYHWYANGVYWLGGGQYESVTYSPTNYGDSVTLQSYTLCSTADAQNSWVAANNAPSFTKTVPSPSGAFGTIGWNDRFQYNANGNSFTCAAGTQEQYQTVATLIDYTNGSWEYGWTTSTASSVTNANQGSRITAYMQVRCVAGSFSSAVLSSGSRTDNASIDAPAVPPGVCLSRCNSPRGESWGAVGCPAGTRPVYWAYLHNTNDYNVGYWGAYAAEGFYGYGREALNDALPLTFRLMALCRSNFRDSSWGAQGAWNF